MTKDELMMRLLKKRKTDLSRALGKVQREIDELADEIRENEQYREFVKGRHCIVCGNRDKGCDFRIPEGIVCTHPSNQNGKDKFRYYMHTCKHWVKETEI